MEVSGRSYRDSERIARVEGMLRANGCDALLVALPRHVLMLTGYFPVVGVSIAICTRSGTVGLLAPEDEKQFAESGWADAIEYFQPVSLHHLAPLTETVIEPLRNLVRRMELGKAIIAVQNGPLSQPSSYSAMNFYGPALRSIAEQALPRAELVDAHDLPERLAAVKTTREIARLRTACSIAAAAFEAGRGEISPGISEMEIASWITGEFARSAASAGLDRQHAFVYCMSGPNSAKAWYAYAHSRPRKVGKRDLVLVHCNSHIDGYWTDITRTYLMGDLSDKARELYSAVLVARNAAIAAVRPGIEAREVDAAARNVIEKHGFKGAFRHPTGHGVGFEAINAHAFPRIHPQSSDILETGMIFNVEPAIYLEGIGGVRQCEMVAVTESGVELLTPFHSGIEQLIIPRRKAA